MSQILDTDKRAECFTIRIPEVTKLELDKLSPTFKKKLNDEILLTMCRVIHESKFDPNLYLKTE